MKPTPTLLESARALISVYDEQSNVAQRIICGGRSDRQLREDGLAALKDLRDAVAALSVPAAEVVGEPVAWAFRNNGDDMWLFARDEPEICYEKQPLYAAPFNQRTEVEPAWWIVTTDMGKVIFHGPDKDRADRVAAIHGREAQPLYAAHPWPDGYVRGHLHLIRCFADDMTERNWEDKRLYIKQQVDFIVSALGGSHE